MQITVNYACKITTLHEPLPKPRSVVLARENDSGRLFVAGGKPDLSIIGGSNVLAVFMKTSQYPSICAILNKSSVCSILAVINLIAAHWSLARRALDICWGSCEPTVCLDPHLRNTLLSEEDRKARYKKGFSLRQILADQTLPGNWVLPTVLCGLN